MVRGEKSYLQLACLNDPINVPILSYLYNKVKNDPMLFYYLEEHYIQILIDNNLIEPQLWIV